MKHARLPGLFLLSFFVGAGTISPVFAWTLEETETLRSSGPWRGDRFGSAVSVFGDTMMIGAPGRDFQQIPEQGNNEGAAYVFTRDETGAWVEEATLLPSGGPTRKTFLEFGSSVALASDIALLRGQDDPTIYVFTRDSSGTWTEETTTLTGDAFALDGRRALIGSGGTAYVFTRDDNGTWEREAKLTRSDEGTDNGFGLWSVALHGRLAVVGAMLDDDKGENAGAAYVFVLDRAGRWRQRAKLLARDSRPNEHFGWSVAIVGDEVIVGQTAGGTSWNDPGVRLGAGAAYVFAVNRDGVWRQKAKLMASDREEGDWFGYSVFARDDIAIIGAPLDDNRNGTQAGAAYLFTRDAGGTWNERAKLIPSDGARYDRFGRAAASMHETRTVMLGSSGADSSAGVATGAVHLFSLDFLEPERRLATLLSQVRARIDARRLPKGLLAPLRVAEKRFIAGKPKAGINQLRAFTRQVNALVRSSRLSRAEANRLIASANQIIRAADTD